MKKNNHHHRHHHHNNNKNMSPSTSVSTRLIAQYIGTTIIQKQSAQNQQKWGEGGRRYPKYLVTYTHLAV